MAPPTMTKQWTTAQDGFDSLAMREVDLPEVKDGEVLVKISAVSLNYRDTEGLVLLILSRGTWNSYD